MQSLSVGGTVKGLPREGEGQQQVSVLAPSVWEQSLDVFNFGARSLLDCKSERTIRWLSKHRATVLVGL